MKVGALLPDYKINLTLNSEVYKNIISGIAKNMGTSRRNVISLAFPDILKKQYSKEDIAYLKNKTITDYTTTVSINPIMQEKLKAVPRHQYSQRVFFGLLVNDYFVQNQHLFVLEHSDPDDKETADKDKGHLEIEIDANDKAKIVDYCEQNAIGISALYAQYILHEDIEITNFEIKNPTMVNILVSDNVKNVLVNRKNESNCTIRFFLKLVTRQIISQLGL